MLKATDFTLTTESTPSPNGLRKFTVWKHPLDPISIIVEMEHFTLTLNGKCVSGMSFHDLDNAVAALNDLNKDSRHLFWVKTIGLSNRDWVKQWEATDLLQWAKDLIILAERHDACSEVIADAKEKVEKLETLAALFYSKGASSAAPH